MATSFGDLVQHAQRLVALTGTTHASFMLPLLLGLTPNEIKRFDETGQFTDDEIESIAARLSAPPIGVKVVFARNVPDDLRDYGNSHNEKKALFQASGFSNERMTSVLRMEDPVRSKVFVLHDHIEIWCAEYDSVDWLVFDEDPRGASETNLAQGYLISLGLGYQTTLDVMEASYRERWPKWEALWRYF